MHSTSPGKADARAALEDGLRQGFLAGLAGDARAYHVFLQRLAGHLRAFFRRRLFNWPHDVEGLVQETLLAVHNQRHTYEPGQPLTVWVHAIARYKLVDLLRARSAREALHDPLDDTTELLAGNDTDAHEARRDLAALLEALPDKQRIPIVEVKLQGRSVAEVALATGMSESAVKVGIHRGLKLLAARLRESKTP